MMARLLLQTCPLTVTLLGIGKKCHSKRQASYFVTLTKQFYYINFQMGHQGSVAVRGKLLPVSLKTVSL